jgi:hypothetical protein
MKYVTIYSISDAKRLKSLILSSNVDPITKKNYVDSAEQLNKSMDELKKIRDYKPLRESGNPVLDGLESFVFPLLFILDLKLYIHKGSKGFH